MKKRFNKSVFISYCSDSNQRSCYGDRAVVVAGWVAGLSWELELCWVTTTQTENRTCKISNDNLFKKSHFRACTHACTYSCEPASVRVCTCMHVCECMCVCVYTLLCAHVRMST